MSSPNRRLIRQPSGSLARPLAELDGLEREMPAILADEETRKVVGARLRELLSQVKGAQEKSGGSIDIDSASTEDLFDFLDNGLR